MADNLANNNVTKSSSGMQMGDISGLQNITDETSLTDIAGAYTDVGHQISDIAQNAFNDVGARQTALIGNDFGQSPANYHSYYQPAATDAQSALRVSGTQHALEVGMDRAKKEAEDKLAAAKNNYNNAQNNYNNLQSTLSDLENARHNFELVEAGQTGDSGTSPDEILNYAQALGSNSADEMYRDVSAKYLSDALVGEGNWDIQSYRKEATDATLAKFGISPEQYNNFSEEEHEAFWARGDVGAYWTNRYARKYAEDMYGADVADEYQSAYEYNYSIIQDVFNNIKNGTDLLANCPAAIKVVNIKAPTLDDIDIKYDAQNNTYVVSGMPSGQGGRYGDTVYTFDKSEAALKGEPDEQGRYSIYSLLTPEQAAVVNLASLDIQKKLLAVKNSGGLPATAGMAGEEAKSEFRALTNYIKNAILQSDKAPINVIQAREVSYVNKQDEIDNMVKGAFGVDLASIQYINDLRANNLQQYEDLLHDYSLVLTYGQVFEIADGEKVYHTAAGDKKLEEGTYVMYTLPGFQDASGDILEPNLKRYIELRQQEMTADTDQTELESEITKSLEGYQKVVTHALWYSALMGVDVSSKIVHGSIYAANPTSNDSKKGEIFQGHTVDEVIETFSKLAAEDGEKAYSIFVKLINKASSVSGSLMASYGGKLVTTSNVDEVGRPMVGSELVSSKGVNTLFNEGDLDKMTVEEAAAVWGVIATSIDQYNSGKTDGNVKSDFLTADGLNWFNQFGIEVVRGLTGIVDLAGNLAWTTTQVTGSMFAHTFSGTSPTEAEIDGWFKSKRWGTGGITGNWTGNTSLYSQFVGDYNTNAFGYGEENQWRMTNNLTHLVNPMLADMWFNDSESQDPSGIGRTGDEGVNYRSAMRTTSSLAGLVASVVAGNYIAKGIGVAAKFSANLVRKVSTYAAANIKGNFARAGITKAAETTERLLNATSKFATTMGGGSKADDIARVAANYTDDAARAAAGVADDVTRAAAGTADDAAKAAGKAAAKASEASTLETAGEKIAGIADDAASKVISTSRSLTDDVARIQANVAERQSVLSQLWASSADDTTRALGAAATSITASSLDDIYDDIVGYSRNVVKAILGDSYTDDTAKAINELVGTNAKIISKRAYSMAHLSSYSGLSVQELSNLSDDATTILSNLAHVQGGATPANMPKDLARYLQGMDKTKLSATIKAISDRSNIAVNAGKAWTADDTIRFLARNGWDSKRLNLLTKQWLKDQLQDLSTDILYGYIKPTVTNEGTDRETIDEYLTNPMNYIFNAGAAGIQFIGGRVLGKAGEAITNRQIPRAQKALELARATGDAELIAKKSQKVMKLCDRANRLADKALERGRTLDDVKKITDEVNTIADDAFYAIKSETLSSLPTEKVAKMAKDSVSFRNALATDMGPTQDAFYAYNAGTSRALANHYRFQRELGSYINGVAKVTDLQTNGGLWNSFFEGRRAALKEMHVNRGDVTVAQQKKIYKKMIDTAVDKYGKSIPGLRTSLTNYFDNLINMAQASGVKKMRAGYLPIESMLNTNMEVAPGLRGFSNGSNVLDPSSANPYLTRSEALKDTEIVEAIMRGDKEITLKDSKGNPIVDEAGVVQTRELHPEGLNLLDSMTNAYNAKMTHDYLDPIFGANDKVAGRQALKNNYIIVKQKGAMQPAVEKSIASGKARMKEIEDEVFSTKSAKAANTKIKNAAKAKAQQIANDNPRLKKVMAKKTVADVTAKERVATLQKQKSSITSNQQEFPAVVMGYVNDKGIIDKKAGFEMFNRYKQIVKSDIAAFQNGEIEVGGTLNTPMYHFDKFSWQYSRNKNFGAKVDGFSHKVIVDNEYYALLAKFVGSKDADPPKDMVMKRILNTQTVSPTDANGNIFSSIGKNGTKYEWTSPLQYFRSSNVTDDALSNIELRSFQRRGNYGTAKETLGWEYKNWTGKQFDDLRLDSPDNIRTAKDIVAKNLASDGVLPTGSNGELNKTAKNMLNRVTNDYLTDLRGAGKGSSAPYFWEYVEYLSTALAEKETFSKAFDGKSAYSDIFTKINSFENTGYTFESFDSYLLDKITSAYRNGEDATDLVKAWATWTEIQGHNKRASGLGENFDTELRNSDRGNLLFESSREAIEQNASNVDLNPEEAARRNEVISKGAKAAEATEEEAEKYLGSIYSDRQRKQASDLTDLVSTVSETPESFQDGLGALKRQLDVFMAGDDFLTRYNARKSLLTELGGGKDANGVQHTGLLNDTRSLIEEAASKNAIVKQKISEYSAQQKHRSEAYGVKINDKNAAMYAYGATPIDAHYSLTKNPSQYRAAKRNLDIYSSNYEVLSGLENELKMAVANYREALGAQNAAQNALESASSASESAKLQKTLSTKVSAVKKAQGAVDEARKRFAKTLEDMGADLTGDFEHTPDWSGSALAYDKMMVEGGSLEGKATQAINALETVRSEIISASSVDNTDLILRIDAKIGELNEYKARVPEYETMAAKNAKGSSQTDSIEMSLAGTMADVIYGDGVEQSSRYMVNPDGSYTIVESKPSNHIFTDQQLNSIGGGSRAAKGTPQKRLGYTIDANGNPVYSPLVAADYGKTAFDFGKYKNVEMELNADISDETFGIALKEGNGNDIKIDKLSLDEIDALNDVFESKNLKYRLMKLDDADAEVIESVGQIYGDYVFVKMKDDYITFAPEAAAADNNFNSLEYNRDAAYTEWLAFSKDEAELQAKLEREMKKAKAASKKADKEADAAAKEKVTDPDDATKKVTYKEVEDESFEGQFRKRATKEQLEEYDNIKKHVEYSENIAKDLDNVEFYRDRNGVVYLNDKSPNLANYATYQNQLLARGWKPLKKNEDVPAVDAKADKKARKEMQAAITKNRHSGDIIDSRIQDWQTPRDKNGNIILDNASKTSTIANMEEIYKQVREVTGLDISREGLLMSNEYADLLTRISGESVEAGKFRKGLNAMTAFAKSVQNIQLAGGMSVVNAYSLAQMRHAVMSDPRHALDYIRVVGSMRNAGAVKEFAADNFALFTKFVMETGDTSIVNDFGAAISSIPGINDGGVTQNMVTNLLNIKKDFIQAKVDNDGSIPKAFKDIVSKDVQDTIFEDATFRNAMPVLRGKMLIENYDAAISKLKKKFPNADGKIVEKAAIQISYAKTQSFFDPYGSIGWKKAGDVLDNTFAKNMRDFAATMVNGKSQTTLLDTMSSFFFALRYKMMLAGRVYDGAISSLPTAMAKVKSRSVKELTEDTLGDVVDTMGTSFMHSGNITALGSLATCAVVAAVTAKALGIPTAWDDVSWIDEYDGSFKIPDVLLKFQTIGQIWLPNSYSNDRGFYADPTKPMYGLDTMSSIFTLQNSFFRTIDRSINPETYYAAPQRGLLGTASSEDSINKFLNAPVPRAIGDELIGSNLLSPFKAVYEVVMDSTYFGNNIWEKKKLPNGKDNPNYDPGRNVAAMTMHILGLDQVLDGGKGYNGWVKGKGTANYVEQDQIGTVKGSGIIQHEFLTAAIDMMNGDYIEAIYGAGELPIKAQTLSSKARTEFNTRVKNIIASYNDEYKSIVKAVDTTNDMKDAAYADYVQKAADAVATWSKKFGYVLGEDQSLVPYVTRTLMAMVSGEYDDNMYYVQDAYWKASNEAQIEGVTSANYWLDDADLEDWIASGKSAEDFAAEKQKRSQAYNKAMDEEYEARKALINAGYPEEYLTKYSYNDFKAEQRILNKEIYTSLHSKLDMPIGEFDNFKEMKAYYEKLIDGASSEKQKVNIAMRYNTYVFDLIAPYAEKYGANIVNDAYYNGKGLSQDLSDYVILPADKKYYGKNPVSSYIKDVFNVGYRNGDALPSDEEIKEKFIVAQNLMMKGAVSSSLAVLDAMLDQIKKGKMYVSDSDYNKIINMRAILSARSR